MTKVALAAVAVLALAGFMAAKIVAPAEAGNVSLADLPALGYSLGARVDGAAVPVCTNYWVETLPAPPVQTIERTDTVTLAAVTLPSVTTTVMDTTAVGSLQARVTALRAQIVRQKKLLAKARRRR